jgi:hypothetical protein
VLCVRSRRYPMNSLSCTVRKSVWASLFLRISWRHIGMRFFFLVVGVTIVASLKFYYMNFLPCTLANQSILHDKISGHPYIPRSLIHIAWVLRTADNTTQHPVFITSHNSRRQNPQYRSKLFVLVSQRYLLQDRNT